MLCNIFGNAPNIQILDVFLENDRLDLSISEIKEKTKLTIPTIQKYVNEYLKVGIIHKTRKIGKAQLYQMTCGPVYDNLLKLIMIPWDEEIIKLTKKEGNK